MYWPLLMAARGTMVYPNYKTATLKKEKIGQGNKEASLKGGDSWFVYFTVSNKIRYAHT